MGLRDAVTDLHDTEREVRPTSLAHALLLTVEPVRVTAVMPQLAWIRALGEVGAMDNVEQQSTKLAIGVGCTGLAVEVLMEVLKMLNPLYHLPCLIKVRQMEKTEEAMRRECEKREVHWMPNGRFKMQITQAESRTHPDKVPCENELKRLGLRGGRHAPHRASMKRTPIQRSMRCQPSTRIAVEPI